MSLILRYLRLYRRPFLLGLLCLIATNALTLLIPWLLKEAIDALSPGTRSVPYWSYVLAIVVSALVLAAIRT